MARLLTLIPSGCKPVPSSGAGVAGVETRLPVLRDANGVCALCNTSGGWLDLYYIDHDHRNLAPDNLLAACPLCRAGQSLHRPSISLEFLPVWLPEITQIAVNRIAAVLHRGLIAAGETPIIDRHHRPARDDLTTRELVSTYLAFANRRPALGVILGGYAPSARELLTLFHATDQRGRGRCPDRLAGGLRLLPLGRYFREGKDRYGEAIGAVSPRPARPGAAMPVSGLPQIVFSQELVS
jgi:hypothetical protein